MKLLILFAAAMLSAQQMPESARPGAHHHQLDTLAGKWEVVVHFKIGNGPEREGRATAEAKWILDGRFLQQEYQSSQGLHVLQFLGYDNQKQKFFEVKFDNSDTGVLHTEGTISADGKVITNTGDRIDPASGKSGKLRTVTTIADPDHYTVEWYLDDVRTVRMEHTRAR